jgi:membrane-associated protein
VHGWLFDHLRWFFAEFGYWAVFLILLMENAGIPLPGETTLLFASFLAFSEHKLQLPYIILFGVFACTLGDNVGYWIGHRGGRPFLLRHQKFFHVSDAVIVRGENLFARYGSVTIFFARFIFGLRIIAGPLAGVLRMPWRSFFLFNFLGAIVWVSVIACVGYFFGQQWEALSRALGRVEIALVITAVLAGFLIWRRFVRRFTP